MNKSIKVKIRPDNSLKFPAICTHCGQPASERMKITKRKGTLTRLIDIPLCNDCYREINRLSWAEERWIRMGRLITALVTLIIFIGSYFLVPEGLPLGLKLLTSVIVTSLIALGLRGIYRQRSAEMASPEKKAILSSAKMLNFSWRATTFSFTREDFSERFSTLNDERLLEKESP